MFKHNLIVLALVAGIASCQPAGKDQAIQGAKDSTAVSVEEAVEPDTTKFTSLFNGKNLEGWDVYGTEEWYVENGLLICESGPDEQYGYLATEKSYKDFILELEFKQAADGNSGVFFRSSIEGTKITGWQVEVAPPDHDTGGIYESYGRGWLVQIPDKKEDILNMGEWNKMRIIVKGNEVTTFLNGKQMVHLEDEKIGQANGSIALQIHDGGGIKVMWRDIKIKTL